MQIKGHVVANPKRIAGQVGAIDLIQSFGVTQLILLDSDLNVFAIYEAERPAVEHYSQGQAQNHETRGGRSGSRNLKRSLDCAGHAHENGWPLAVVPCQLHHPVVLHQHQPLHHLEIRMVAHVRAHQVESIHRQGDRVFACLCLS